MTKTRPFTDVFEIPLKNGLNRPKDVRGAGIPMVNMGEVFAHRRIRNIPMDRVALPERERTFLLRSGDLLFARQSLVLSGAGKCVLFQGNIEETTFESHIIRARLDARIADPAFYFYYFNSPVGRGNVEGIVEQVAAAGIRGSDLARLQVPVPPLAEQRAITHVLGALDDKIELNRRMNATLEEMARTLFRSWFVDFEPFGGVMPDNWRFGKVDALGEVICGKTPPTNNAMNYGGEMLFITIPDMHGKVFVTETAKTLSEIGVSTQQNKTLPPNSICVSCIATPGLVVINRHPAQTNQQINSVKLNTETGLYFAYYTLEGLADQIKAGGSGGSVLLN
ncbi:MAG: restriction endonuclease subunit S, partial [Armatimonadetes bacterium]|nr:restriction endonuclease subunit S [Armatimonadota bacterium]